MPRLPTKSTRKRTRGGFIPSIMEGFCVATSKYITPIALLIIHRMTASATTKKGKKRTRKGHSAKR